MNKTTFLLATTLLVLSTSMMNPASAKEDLRNAIVLTQDERNLVLEEMRTFLETVRVITVALGKDDMAGVVEPARKVGMASSGEVPAGLREKLPKQFKMFAMSTHKAFDLIALDAQELEDKQHTLEQLGSLMSNCVSCHAIYRLEAENTKGKSQ